jgi:glycosyltransferase EpsF
MPRVLHLVTSMHRGGIETWLLRMLQELRGSEYVLDICCKGQDIGALADQVTETGAVMHQCILRPDHIRFGRCLSQLITQGRYDIVHNHLELYSGFPSWIGQRVPVPVISSFHNTHFAPQTRGTRRPGVRQARAIYGWMSVRYALRASAAVTGCSRDVVEQLAMHRHRSGRRPADVLHYGVDLPEPASEDERATFREELGYPTNAHILLHVGRFLEQKNHGGVLSIFRQVLSQHPTARLVLVGDGLLRPRIEDTIERYGIRDYVTLLGLRSDAVRIMTMSDLLLLPSYHEGFPMVALEAGSAGLPIVGSRIPGLQEAVVDGETALLHEVADLQGMALSASCLLATPELHQRMSKAGRDHVARCFSAHASARRMTDLYDAVLGQESS